MGGDEKKMMQVKKIGDISLRGVVTVEKFFPPSKTRGAKGRK